MSRTTTRQAAQRARQRHKRKKSKRDPWGSASQGGVSSAAWAAGRKGREMIARINAEKRRRWAERAAEKAAEAAKEAAS